MSSPSHILTRALGDCFKKVSNPICLGHDLADILRALVRASNKVFEQDGFASISSITHFVMDMDLVGPNTPLRAVGDTSLVLNANIYDTCTSDLHRQLIRLPQPGLIIRYHENGLVECGTLDQAMFNTWDKPGKIHSAARFRAHDRHGIEGYIASWLRSNLDAKTLVAIADAVDEQDQKDAEDFRYWSQSQFNRVQQLNKK